MDTNQTRKTIQIKSLDNIQEKGVEQELDLEETSLIIGGQVIADESGQDVKTSSSVLNIIEKLEGGIFPHPLFHPNEKPFLKIL